MTEQQESYFWVMTVDDEPELEAEADPGDVFENLMDNDTPASSSPEGGKAVRSTVKQLLRQAKQRVKPVAVPVQTVENNMKEMLKQLGGMLQRVQEDVQVIGGMELDEIEVQLEISGAGEVGFMGTGVEAGSRGAIALKFKRPNSPQA